MLNLNSQLKRIEQSKIKQFNEFAKENNVKYNLAIGDPYLDTPQQVKRACIKAIKNNYTHYAPAAGFLDVREKIAVFENKMNETNYGYDNVIITNGSTEAIAISLLSILNENDEVILFLPSYNLYRPIIELAKARAITINTEDDQFQINKDKIAKAINAKTKAIIINNPNNPTGIVYNSDSCKNILDIIKKHNIWLIIDSVYEQIIFTNYSNVLLKEKDINEKIIICQSFSKSYAMTGWRIGYLVGNKDFIEQANKLHQIIMVSVNSFIQKTISTILETDNSMIINKYRTNRDYAYNRLLKMGLDVNNPSGGLYLFPSIKKYNINSWDFCKQLLLKYETAILPSNCFEIEGYIRISYCVDFNILKKALDNLKHFLEYLETANNNQ